MSRFIIRSGRLVGLAFLTAVLLGNTARIQGQAPTTGLDQLAKIEKLYSIEIATANLSFPVKSTYGAIDGKAADSKELGTYISLFAPEFSIYPVALVRQTRLKRVVLCKRLSFAGQLRNAVPDFEHDTLYLEVSRGSLDTLYLRKVLHHEFFHIIDWRDDGLLYQDVRWASLNPAGFTYGTGGRNAQERLDSAILTDGVPGFLNYYSTTGVEEDKAELFANLIVEPAYVEKRAGNEPVLRAKIKLMKDLLKSFCLEMNAEFWQKLSLTRRT